MKRRILMLLIRLARLLKMEEKLMPELKTVPDRQVRVGKIYRHYGRVVISHANPSQVDVKFANGYGSRIREDEYYRLLDADKPCSVVSASGTACSQCDFNRLGLPCRCDFNTGIFTGYYEVIMTGKQYSTNLRKPSKIRITK